MTCPSEVKPGTVIRDPLGEAKVIAIAQGYLMARRKYCTPFVLKVEDVGKQWRVDGNDRVEGRDAALSRTVPHD